MYEKSMLFLKQLDHKPSKKEWNILAQKHTLLSTYSLRIITNINNFSELCSIVRKRNKN